MEEGRGTFVVGDQEIEVGAAEIAIVPPSTAHRLVNPGDDPLRRIDIHVSLSFSTEWL